jgi:hypothetical protein
MMFHCNISSVHGKDAALELERLSEASHFVPKWIADKENVLNWLGIARLEAGSHTTNPKHFSVAKIIREFENPKPGLFCWKNQVETGFYNIPSMHKTMPRAM